MSINILEFQGLALVGEHQYFELFGSSLLE